MNPATTATPALRDFSPEIPKGHKKPLRGLSLIRTYRLMIWQVNAGKMPKASLWEYLGGLSRVDLDLMVEESRAKAQ